MSMNYVPSSWTLGVVVEVIEGAAKVLPSNRWGQIKTGKEPVCITPKAHRAIEIGLEGLRFSKQLVEVIPGEIEMPHGGRKGTLVVFERRFAPQADVAYGWTTLRNYSEALDIYDERFSPRVVSPRERMMHPPQAVLYPDRLALVKEHQSSVPAPEQIGHLESPKLDQIRSEISAPKKAHRPNGKRARKMRLLEAVTAA